MTRCRPPPLALLALVAACRAAQPSPEAISPDGGMPPAVARLDWPDDRSGSRLRLEWWTAADGAAAPGAIHDSLLGVECHWAPFEGGHRCLPRTADASRYSDPACTVPLLVHIAGSCLPLPDYVAVPPAAPTCPASKPLRRRGARVQPAEVFAWLEGVCKQTRESSIVELYELGDPVPASTFVGATRTVEPVADGWSRVFLDAEDGSRWTLGPRRGESDCQVDTAADGALRCLPARAAIVNPQLLEADCTTPVAMGARSSCRPEEAFLWWGRMMTPCGYRFSVLRASRRLDVGYYKSSGCQPLVDPFSEIYAVGEALPAGDFPAANRGTLEAPGRLKRYATSTPAGTRGDRPLEWWDSKLGGRCVGAPLARDGTRRCFPNAELVSLFADAACTRRLVEEFPCRPSLFALEAVPDPDACAEPRFRVFRVGPVISADMPYKSGGGRCFPAGSSARTPVLVREVGDEVDPAEFVELSRAP